MTRVNPLNGCSNRSPSYKNGEPTECHTIRVVAHTFSSATISLTLRYCSPKYNACVDRFRAGQSPPASLKLLLGSTLNSEVLHAEEAHEWLVVE